MEVEAALAKQDAFNAMVVASNQEAAEQAAELEIERPPAADEVVIIQNAVIHAKVQAARRLAMAEMSEEDRVTLSLLCFCTSPSYDCLA